MTVKETKLVDHRFGLGEEGSIYIMENAGNVQHQPTLGVVFPIWKVEGMPSSRQILTHLLRGWHGLRKTVLIDLEPHGELLQPYCLDRDGQPDLV